MRQNLVQVGEKGVDGFSYIDGDWYPRGIPPNVLVEKDAYLDTSYGFAAFHSRLDRAMQIGTGTGCYDRATFITGKNAQIQVGRYVILNGTTLISQESIVIGDHCMLAWGSILTDSYLDHGQSTAQRRMALHAAARDPRRCLPVFGKTAPIVLEDNCWIGFDAVVLPGIRLGHGCVVGSKSVVTSDVPPYAIVAGNPARIIRYLEPDDTEEMRQQAFSMYLKASV